MKVRSKDEFLQKVDDDLQERKHEITNLKFFLGKTKRLHQKSVLRRAAVMLLYAHWEGFIKHTAELYIRFVSQQRGSVADYKSNFIALAFRSRIREAGQSTKMRQHRELVDCFLEGKDISMSGISPENEIRASNLSSEVLQEILETIGIEDDNYWCLKENFIDHTVLTMRNRIAHGNLDEVDESTVEEIRKFVVSSMDRFRDMVENAVVNELYRRS